MNGQVNDKAVAYWDGKVALVEILKVSTQSKELIIHIKVGAHVEVWDVGWRASRGGQIIPIGQKPTLDDVQAAFDQIK